MPRDDVIRKEYQLEQPVEEEFKGESEILDFDNSPFKFAFDSTHNWIQRGFYAHCTNCSLEHGLWIGPDKIMVGIKDNLPVLEPRKV